MSGLAMCASNAGAVRKQELEKNCMWKKKIAVYEMYKKLPYLWPR